MTTSYEQQQIDLVAENKALKAQVNEIKVYIGAALQQAFSKERDQLLHEAKRLTPNYCLNSVKKEAIEVFARDCSESSLKLSMAAMEYCDNLLRGNQ